MAYVVVREWQSEKRTNRLAAGPFATRARAQTFVRRHMHMNVYESRLHIVPLRAASWLGGPPSLT